MSQFTSRDWQSDAPVSRGLERISDLGELADVLSARRARLEAAVDARAPFCAVYATYAACFARANHAGAFGEGSGWLARLEIDAATQYLRALDAWDRRNLFAISSVWRCVFAATKYGTVTRAEGMRFSLIAHLSYDLPLAVARADDSSVQSAGAERAFTCASELLAANAAAMRELLEVIPPELRSLRRSAVPLLSAEWLALMRGRAWEDGQSLLAAAADRRAAEFARIERASLAAMRTG
jgi:hypothetical protein